jgi:hypothetical protein
MTRAMRPLLWSGKHGERVIGGTVFRLRDPWTGCIPYVFLNVYSAFITEGGSVMNPQSVTLIRVALMAGIAGIVGASGHAEAQTIPEYEFTLQLSPVDANGGGQTHGGMKIGAAKDNPVIEEPPTVQFINVPSMPAEATEIEVVLVYRDANGILRETTTGTFGAGCEVERTDDGVDVVCPLVSETP